MTRPLIPKCRIIAPVGACNNKYFPRRVMSEMVVPVKPACNCFCGIGKRISLRKNFSSFNILFFARGRRARLRVSTSGSSGMAQKYFGRGGVFHSVDGGGTFEDSSSLVSDSSCSEASGAFLVGALAVTTFDGRRILPFN